MIIWAIARTTIGDAMRKKVLQIFLVVTLGLIVLSLGFSQTLSGFSTKSGAGSDLMMLKSFGMGLLAVAGALISLILGVSIIPQEIERRTIYTILSKPVKRYEFILGKLVGAVLTLGICIGLMGVVYVGTIMAKAYGAMEPAPVGPGVAGAEAGSAPIQIFDPNTVITVLMIYLQFVVLTSVLVLFSVFLTPTVNFFMGGAVYVIGMMSTITQAIAGADAEKTNRLTIGLYKLIHTIIPNFDAFNITNQILHPETQVGNIWKYTGIVSGYAILFALIMALLGVIIFESKEV